MNASPRIPACYQAIRMSSYATELGFEGLFLGADYAVLKKSFSILSVGLLAFVKKCPIIFEIWIHFLFLIHTGLSNVELDEIWLITWYLTWNLTSGRVIWPEFLNFPIRFRLDLGYKALIFASTTNLESGSRFADIW